MKRLLILILIITFLNHESAFAVIRPGTKIIYFTVEDIHGKKIDTDSIKGRVVAGFYEDRYATEKNKKLKDALKDFYKATSSQKKFDVENNIFKLAVIDGTPANIATKWVWKRKIKIKSAENKINIYIDWDGNMKKAFVFPDDESTFIIIDREGIIRYIMSGIIPETEFDVITELMYKITK
jgi:predicted transcriptional regulator